MFRTFMFRTAISGFAALALSTGVAHAQNAKYTAKIGHLESPAQPRHQGLLKVAALVKSRTNGEVELQLFPSSQLGNARQMIKIEVPSTGARAAADVAQVELLVACGHGGRPL